MLTVKIFRLNPVSVNTYILYNDLKEALIIDPGCYIDEERETLQNFIESKGLQPVQLLNTHCHLDHVFGNKWVYETYALELFLHPNEEQVLQFAPQSGKMWGLVFENYEGPLHFLQQDDIVKIGEDSLKVLLAPGHSPGSICFYCEEQKFIIGGDVLFKESIGRTDLPGGNHNALLQSIREQLFVLPDDVVVYPGHGDPTTIGHEKKYNPFLQG
ncbi:MAG: fold metallo-hydrolase [Segetibacter sp.]|jgi:hydroxyacylglutathione hydrolase|nr:fold metallo-hydrolase [Segetibacter sp.]